MNKAQLLNSLLVLLAIFAGYGLGKSPATTAELVSEATVAAVEPTSGNQTSPFGMNAATTGSAGLSLSDCRMPANWIFYRIQPGDQAEQLAAATGLTVDELRCANGLPTADLYVGQIIYLPVVPTMVALTGQATAAPNKEVVGASAGADSVADVIQTDNQAGQVSVAATQPTVAPPPAILTLIPVPLIKQTLLPPIPTQPPTPTRLGIPQQEAPTGNQRWAPVESANEEPLPAPQPTQRTPVPGGLPTQPALDLSQPLLLVEGILAAPVAATAVPTKQPVHAAPATAPAAAQQP